MFGLIWNDLSPSLFCFNLKVKNADNKNEKDFQWKVSAVNMNSSGGSWIIHELRLQQVRGVGS